MPEAALAARVVELERQVRLLLLRVTELESQLLPSDSASAGFELVGTGNTASASGAEQIGSGTGSTRAPPPGGAERTRILRQVADWLVRSLNGEHRGTSGRDSLSGPSRYYIIARGIDNKVYHPLKVVSPWAAAAPLVKRGSSIGDSIFIGLPRWDDVVEVSALSGLPLEPRDGSTA